MAKVHPIGSRIVVEQVEAEVKTEGGILIPTETANKIRPAIGVVLEVGMKENGAWALDIPVGAKVAYNQFAGTDVEVFRGRWHKILNVEDVLAVYEE